MKRSFQIQTHTPTERIKSARASLLYLNMSTLYGKTFGRGRKSQKIQWNGQRVKKIYLYIYKGKNSDWNDWIDYTSCWTCIVSGVGSGGETGIRRVGALPQRPTTTDGQLLCSRLRSIGKERRESYLFGVTTKRPPIGTEKTKPHKIYLKNTGLPPPQSTPPPPHCTWFIADCTSGVLDSATDFFFSPPLPKII